MKITTFNDDLDEDLCGHVQKEEKRSFKCGMETNLVTDKKGPMEKGFFKTN